MGALVYDLPRFAWLVRGKSTALGQSSWTRYRNRNERLITDKTHPGVQCDWRWTSDLHLAKVFPHLGRVLMRRCFADWPIDLADSPAYNTQNPKVSFIIGHRGNTRVPHLLMTLKSIAAQRDVAAECIVVEQSNEREVEDLLPSWVRYIHTPLPRADMPYNRSSAFNAGAESAHAELLIFHDNDMLMPLDYAMQMRLRHDEGYEVINLKRFIFYLDQNHSSRITKAGALSLDRPPEVVMQNLEAGGSFCITRDAYFAIGGFDDSFVGWGGEDNEFWERAQTRKVWPFGYLPLLHLWHESQPGKHAKERDTHALFEQRSGIPVEKRIAELRARNFGVRRATSKQFETATITV